VATTLKQFKLTGYFSAPVRAFLADFAVIIGILSMTALDYFVGLPTPKLVVPSEFKPTWEGRGWVILDENLFHNPWWVDVFLAPVFAILATILIFMDQQITAVIVNNKQYKMKKGCGYHLDLLALAVILLVSSVLGLPWFVANTIPAICHVQSLGMESTTSIPGEKPKFLGVREQRVTGLLIAICTGLSVLMVPVLSLLPMPVLYGVFLYMGISALRGLQFFDRILLFFMPTKTQPNYIYLKYVRLNRVHLFTFIQVLALIGLYFIKSYKKTSITFPVMLVIICVIRKAMEAIFTTGELRALDDLLPGREREKRKLGFINSSKSGSYSLADEEMSLEAGQDIKSGQRNGTVGYQEELEELMEQTPCVKPPRAYNRNFSRLVSTVMSMKPVSPPPTKTTLMFLRLEEDDVFVPVHLTPVTLDRLLNVLKDKFPILQETQIGRILHKTTKGITYLMDEAMVDYIEPRTVFVLSLSTDEANVTTVIFKEQEI